MLQTGNNFYYIGEGASSAKDAIGDAEERLCSEVATMAHKLADMADMFIKSAPVRHCLCSA